MSDFNQNKNAEPELRDTLSIKSLLCLFGGQTEELNALSTAFNLARHSAANLRILHAAEPPILYESVIATGIAPTSGDGSVTGLLERDARDLASMALTHVTDFAATHMVPLVPDGTRPVFGAARATFRPVIGPAADRLPEQGRTVDLIVTGYEKSGDGALDVLLAALFKTAAPVLAVPHFPGRVMAVTGFARSVAVAWDGSMAAARALRAAMPHLMNARDVYLVSVEGMDEPIHESADADIRDYLASHGITAESVHCERTSRGVGQCLLDKARDLDVDLLVMGAYGRTHIGEMILGGVTNHVIKHTCVALLLAH